MSLTEEEKIVCKKYFEKSQFRGMSISYPQRVNAVEFMELSEEEQKAALKDFAKWKSESLENEALKFDELAAQKRAEKAEIYDHVANG